MLIEPVTQLNLLNRFGSNDVQVLSGQKQSVTVKISDNPIALVTSGSKTLALSISDNPSSFNWMEVDLNIDHVALNRAKFVLCFD